MSRVVIRKMEIGIKHVALIILVLIGIIYACSFFFRNEEIQGFDPGRKEVDYVF